MTPLKMVFFWESLFLQLLSPKVLFFWGDKDGPRGEDQLLVHHLRGEEERLWEGQDPLKIRISAAAVI